MDEPNMSKPVFDDYYKVLDKASDRARSVLYVFIVVHLAVLLYGLYGFAYPARQYNYDEVREYIQCLHEPMNGVCTKRAKAADKTWPEANEPIKTWPDVKEPIGQTFWAHQMQLSYDESVAARTFKFPIFGLETDRDLLWLIFPMIGIIGYFIVWAGLTRLSGMFKFLWDRNWSDPVRLRLIQSTVVSSRPVSNHGRVLTGIYQIVWELVAVLVFAIPVFVVLLMMADQTNAIATLIHKVPNQHFLFENWSFLAKSKAPKLIQLAVEAVFLVLQIGLLIEIGTFANAFHRDQMAIDQRVAELEAMDAAHTS
jgi:hypothetical protein